MELLSSFAGMNVLFIQKKIKSKHDQGRNVYDCRRWDSMCKITEIRITTIDERTLTKEIRRTWRARFNTTFGNLRLTIQNFNSIFLNEKQIFFSLKIFNYI